MKTEVVDLNVEKQAVIYLVNKLHTAWDNQDLETMTSLVSEDAIFYGNGPSEVYNKEQVSEGWKQIFAQPFPLDLVGEPIISVSPNGNSAYAIQQYYMPPFSTKIQFRNGYFLNKVGGNWLICTCNTACLLNDDDFPKINEILSK